jgi:hypothetical protein
MNETMRPETVEVSIGMARQLSVDVPTFNERDNMMRGAAFRAHSLDQCSAAGCGPADWQTALRR